MAQKIRRENQRGMLLVPPLWLGRKNPAPAFFAFPEKARDPRLNAKTRRRALRAVTR